MDFYYPQDVYFLGEHDGLSDSVVFAQNCSFLQARMEQSCTTWKVLSLFSNRKINFTARAEKVDEKVRSFV